MGVSHQDVEMLNRSMQNLGNSFAQRRAESYQRERDGKDDVLKSRMLDMDTKKFDAQQAGELEAWLQGESGSPVRYQGSKQGLDALVHGAAQQGKKLSIVGKPDASTRKKYKVTTQLPFGVVEMELDTEDELEQAAKTLKQAGGQTQGGTAADVGKDQYAARLEEEAAKEQDATRKQSLLDRAKQIRSGIGRVNEEDYTTVTDESNYDPMADRFRTRETRKVKRGFESPKPAPQPAPAVPQSTQPDIRTEAIKAIQSGKDPSSVRARYKQMTGKDADF